MIRNMTQITPNNITLITYVCSKALIVELRVHVIFTVQRTRVHVIAHMPESLKSVAETLLNQVVVVVRIPMRIL